MAAQIIPSLFYMFHVGPPLSDTFFLNIHMIRLQSLQMLIVANNAMIYTNSLLMTFFCWKTMPRYRQLKENSKKTSIPPTKKMGFSC